MFISLLSVLHITDLLFLYNYLFFFKYGNLVNIGIKKTLN